MMCLNYFLLKCVHSCHYLVPIFVIENVGVCNEGFSPPGKMYQGFCLFVFVCFFNFTK